MESIIILRIKQVESMNTFIGYILLMTLMFSLAAGLYYGLKTIRLI